MQKETRIQEIIVLTKKAYVGLYEKLTSRPKMGYFGITQ